MKRVLLTILGLDPKPAEYEFAGNHQTTTLAPAALFDLLPTENRPTVVVALCTEQARSKTLPELEAALSGKAEVLSADIPSGADAQDVDHFLSAMVAACEKHAGATVTVDVTHGFRHFSFLMYTGALYLAALGRVSVDAIYYALLNPHPKVSPFFDLTPLLELPRWMHALETLQETGSAKVVAKLCRHTAAASGTDGQAIAEIMDRVSDAHRAGLPIELGREICRFFTQKEKPFRKLLRSDHRLPLSEGVANQLHSLLAAYELKGTAASTSSKKGAVLDKDELERQAALIADLLHKGNLPAALGLMNEWTVSWALWSMGETTEWLDFRRQRRKAAGLLGALEAIGRDASLKASITEQQQRLVDYWGRLGSLRNALHHHGMRPQVLLDGEFNGKVEQVRRYWAEELRGLPAIPLECGSRRYRHLVVSPIGERPGVLFSAIKRASSEGLHPDFCLVICSQRTETAVPEALSRAGFTGETCSLRLEDPYSGKQERKKLTEESRQYLASADRVSVNITGGTTLMGVVAEDLAQEAQKLARPVRRFALIDRRSPEAQKGDPFVEGDILWLDNEERDGDY